MAKRKADSPLHALSPNKPLRATRRSSRTTPVSKWPPDKENENGRGSVTPLKSQLKTSELLPGEISSWKRNRLGVVSRPNSDDPTAQKRIKRSLKVHSLSESRISISRKDDSTAERPLGKQLSNGLCSVDGYWGGTSGNQHNFTEVAVMHSRGPQDLNRCLTRRSEGPSPSGPVSNGKDLPSRNRNMDKPGFKDVETRHESTSEGNGNSENQIVKLRDEDIADRTATEKRKEGALLSVQRNSVCNGEGRIDQLGNDSRCPKDKCVELTTADHHTPLEERVETIGLVLAENVSRGNLRNQSTSAETDKLVSVKTKNSSGSDGRERTHGVPNGTVQANRERCPTCSGVGRPYVDAEAVQVLEEAYNKLYKKYQRSKMRNVAQFESIYDEQTRKFAAFSTAADAFVEKLREENNFLTRQLQETDVQESINRSRRLEEEFIECRNDLVMERSKVLELEQELREAHLCILELRTSRSNKGPVFVSTSSVPAPQSWDIEASQVEKLTIGIAARPQSLDLENERSSKSPSALLEEKDEMKLNTKSGVESECAKKEPSAEGALHSARETEIEGCALQPDSETFATRPGGDKLLHELLQRLTQMSTIVDGNSCRIIFTHDESGFSFKLEQNKLSQEVGGDDALLYQVVAPGTILHLGPAWMQSEIVFDMVQAHVFFERILAVAFGCHSN